MHVALQQNTKVLTTLALRRLGTLELAAHDSIANPYLACGCHSDIVERVWDQLGASLSEDGRCLIHGVPALVQRAHGLILAVALGMQYGVRLPLTSEEATPQRLWKTRNTASGGQTLNVREALGEDWVFGAWKEDEPRWCRQNSERTPHAEAAAIASPAWSSYSSDLSPEEELAAMLSDLEQRALLHDPEAEFKLFRALFNAALKTGSQASLDRAGSLLAAAASHGSKEAAALSVAWPRMKSDAERKINGSSAA